MIEIVGLTHRYGRLVAVDGLDLTVGEGEVFGFLGPNGAGKTTTIEILATLLRPTEGRALVGGLDVRRHGRRVRRMIGYMPDAFGVYENLRVHEYLEFFAAAYDVPRGDRLRILGDVLELTDLGHKRDALVGGLSRGMQQRLGLARVLVHDPALLLLDEPASGLDPRARIELREILRELRSMGKTILISSHILPEIAEVCTSLGVIRGGRLVAAGPVADVLAAAGAGDVVRARVEGELDGALDALGRLAGVERVDHPADGELHVHFTSGDGRAGAPEVAALLVAHGLRVKRLDEETLGLEEAYLRLTAEADEP